MDFFGHQDAARRRTGQLIVLFALALAGVVAAVYTAVRILLVQSGVAEGEVPFWDPVFAGQVAFVTLSVVLVASIYKTLSLHRGGAAIAGLLGGRQLVPNSAHAEERRLLNVVEEMALAAGVPVPTVYRLDKETSINAFAAGFSPADAVIGVTRGTMEKLSRDQLQGVIAHEFSHILNNDTRINLRLVGLLHGILVIAMIGRIVLESSGRGGSSKKGNGLALLGLAFLAIGGIGVFFGRWIKAAISRQREFLADAAAVQFTRNPSGLAGALQLIAGRTGSKVENAHAEEASHFFFANGLKKNFLSMLATHPPIEQRIARLDPQAYPGLLDERGPAPIFENREGEGGEDLAGVVAGLASQPVVGATAPGLAAAGLIHSVGKLEKTHVDYARRLVEALPAGLREAAREPVTAQAIVLCLLLDPDPGVRAHQSAIFGEMPAPLRYEVSRIAPLVAHAPRPAHLPLLDLAMPALNAMSPEQARQLVHWVDKLAMADQRLSLFELVLQRALRRHLEGRFGSENKAKSPPKAKLEAFASEIRVLLSALAHAGHPQDPERARMAYAIAGQEIFQASRLRLNANPLDAAQCGLVEVDRALAELDRLLVREKKPLLAACAAVVAADLEVQVEEGELLRVIADSLGCPVPPLLPGQPAAV